MFHTLFVAWLLAVCITAADARRVICDANGACFGFNHLFATGAENNESVIPAASGCRAMCGR